MAPPAPAASMQARIDELAGQLRNANAEIADLKARLAAQTSIADAGLQALQQATRPGPLDVEPRRRLIRRGEVG